MTAALGTQPYENEYLIGVAMRLAGIVQMFDPAEADQLLYGRPATKAEAAVPGLAGDELRDLYLTLAGMVPIDRTAEELLAWHGVRFSARLRMLTGVAPASKLTPRPGDAGKKLAAECGTRRGYLAHARNGDPPGGCVDCETANFAWERMRASDNQTRWAAARDNGQAELPIGDQQEDTSDAA